MIRTVIEIQAEHQGDYEMQLHATLDKLGYEPKAPVEVLRWREDLYNAMLEKGIVPHDIVEEYRKAREPT